MTYRAYVRCDICNRWMSREEAEASKSKCKPCAPIAGHRLPLRPTLSSRYRTMPMTHRWRKPRIALLDRVHGVAYSRAVQRNHAGYTEDEELQAVLDDKGFEVAKQFAMRRYHGVMIAVYCGIE